MASHTHNAQVGRLEVVETGRRRRWSEEEKLRIVTESLIGPRLVSATAPTRFEERRAPGQPSFFFGAIRDFTNPVAQASNLQTTNLGVGSSNLSGRASKSSDFPRGCEQSVP